MVGAYLDQAITSGLPRAFCCVLLQRSRSVCLLVRTGLS